MSDKVKSISKNTFSIEHLILNIRDQRVILDSDLAFLYGVETKALNQAVTRNASRFPEEFAFRLSKEEFQNLKSQFVTSSLHGGKHKLPRVFTEHGALMAANILRSKQAVRVSIEVIKAFVRLRKAYLSAGSFSKKVDELESKQKVQDKDIKLIFDALRKLLGPEVSKSKKGRIGFDVGE